MEKFKRIEEIARQIAALDQELRRLVNADNAVNVSDSGRVTETAKVEKTSAVAPGGNGSLAGRMYDFMERNPKRIFTAKKMTAGMGLPPEEERAVRLNLSRFYRTKKVTRLRRGHYRFRERQGGEAAQ